MPHKDKTMDISRVFRNLVTNQYMPDFDYAGSAFSFKTVFGVQAAFSYCICECGFKLEYLDFITQSGEIDERKYESVLQCMIDGRCPHVSQVSTEFVKESRIYAIHIAVAVGTSNAFVDGLSRLPIRYGALYRLDPYEVALLKNSKDKETMTAVRECFHKKDNYQIRLVSAERSIHDPNKLTLKPEKVLDFLSRIENVSLLKSYLSGQDEASIFTCKDDMFRLSLANNLEEELGMDNFLAKFDKFLQYVSENTIWTILYYDKAEVLDAILPSLTNILKDEKAILEELHQICSIFQSKKSMEVLQKHGLGIPEDFEMSSIDKILKLEYLLTIRPQILKDEIARLILQTQKLDDYVQLPRLRVYILSYNRLFRVADDPEVLRKLLDCVDDVNVSLPYGRTPLVDLLSLSSQSGRCPYITISETVTLRQMAELYIFENPTIESRDTAVNTGYGGDEKLFEQNTDRCFSNFDFRLIGSYKMDGKQHSLFGHDHQDDFALNFIVPLLLECGFPLLSYGLQMPLEHRKLHPAEKDYIQRYMCTTRSLKVGCRNALRKHFQGRKIHKFVEQSELPSSVDDFLLLRSLLKCVPVALLR